MRADQTTATPAAEQQPAYTYAKKKDTRWWEVRETAGELVCLTVYRRGAREVVRRLAAGDGPTIHTQQPRERSPAAAPCLPNRPSADWSLECAGGAPASTAMHR